VCVQINTLRQLSMQTPRGNSNDECAACAGGSNNGGVWQTISSPDENKAPIFMGFMSCLRDVPLYGDHGESDGLFQELAWSTEQQQQQQPLHSEPPQPEPSRRKPSHPEPQEEEERVSPLDLPQSVVVFAEQQLQGVDYSKPFGSVSPSLVGSAFTRTPSREGGVSTPGGLPYAAPRTPPAPIPSSTSLLRQDPEERDEELLLHLSSMQRRLDGVMASHKHLICPLALPPSTPGTWRHTGEAQDPHLGHDADEFFSLDIN